ncbi:MAG TPA: hypothetical protein VK988_16385 [Acidimicrobiales bacterium]|nr:hypothetical protein [Acidimicrobiales bacterium]
MVVRTQIAFDPEDHRRARAKAAALGVSLAEYVRRLVARDLESPRPAFDVSSVFNLGDSGRSDVAAHKDTYVGAALTADDGQ